MKTTLITGASSGIGLEFARIFAGQNYNLVLVARSKEKLQELKKELEKLKIQVTVIVADLSKKETPQKIKDALKKEKIKIDILVNNAGFGDLKEFKDSDLKKMEDMIQVNITSLTTLTHLFMQDIISNKGGILNVGSVAGFIPGPKMAVYYATKAYVISFSEAIAKELEKDEVTVSVLCPGPVKTGFAKAADIDGDAVVKGKIPSAREVAEFGYKMFKKGKVVAVHGLKMNMLKNTVRLLPRHTVVNIVSKMQEL